MAKNNDSTENPNLQNFDEVSLTSPETESFHAKATQPKPLKSFKNSALDMDLEIGSVTFENALQLNKIQLELDTQASTAFLRLRKKLKNLPTEQNPNRRQQFRNEGLPDQSQNIADYINTYINANGLTKTLRQVNERINNTSLHTFERHMMAEPVIYAYTLYHAFFTEEVNLHDVEGIHGSSMRCLSQVKKQFYIELISAVLEAKWIDVSRLDESIKNYLVKEVLVLQPRLTQGTNPSAVILEVFDKARKEGPLNDLLQYYLEKEEISPKEMNSEIRNLMLDYLRKLDINMQMVQQNIKNGSKLYDEYFLLAYDYAQRMHSNGTDPIDQYRNKNTKNTWDFKVETFDTEEEIGVVPKNIRAAAALFYTYVLGDALGIYKLVSALILKWANGQLDITDPVTESKLYRYYKLTDQRASAEERHMLYKRALNLGESKLLDGMVVNSQFTQLWHSLMNEIADYITKMEGSSNRDFVSKLPIYQLMQDIQYNLTHHMNGMGHIQVTEMYNQLRDALEIMQDKNITDQLAVSLSKNLWSVIDNLYKDTFHASVNISAFKTAAVSGYKMLYFLSDFNKSTITENSFKEFIRQAESYIQAVREESITERESNQEIDELDDELKEW
jgi:hypothetical protein